MKIASLVFAIAILTGRLYGQNISTEAKNFLELTKNVKVESHYPMSHAERFNFNFVPLERKGPTFYDFDEKQKAAAMSLLKASLSQQGYTKATNIVDLENVLRIVETRPPNDKYRDPMNYHFLLFGTPGSEAWGWKFEGHHISLNFTLKNNELVSSTPSFMGSNPGIVPVGDQKGKQVLKLETELGFKLVNALDEKQLAIARFSEVALPEIVTGNDKKARALDPKGIAYTSLTEPQKQIMLQLLDVYIRNYEFGFSEKLMAKIKKAGIENLSFAWAGSMSPGAGHYYRIQGPMLLIEYDNTQTNANHVHAVVRDLTNDFAEDILREHYLKEH